MADTKLHPRFLEGIARQISMDATSTQKHRQAALGHLDTAIGTLQGMTQEPATLCAVIPFSSLIDMYIEDCELARFQIESFDSGGPAPLPNLANLLKRLSTLEKLVSNVNRQALLAAPQGST